VTEPPAPEPTMTEAESRNQMVAALGRIPSGLFILTVTHGDSETGMLASWVQQCSFEPPQVSVAIRRDRDVNAWLTTGAAFVLNILDDSQTDMIVHFGRGFALDAAAFTDLDVDRTGSGPVLREALAYLDCRVVTRCPVGDHDLLIARLIGGRLLSDSHPMVHIRKTGSHY
jgi:flavin reductase (DIM6/NTAB) family NADH-FMN oxidoreductase RutF